MKNRMINRLFKLALISLASPIMGAQTPFFTATSDALEAPESLFSPMLGAHTQFITGASDALEAPEPLFVFVDKTKTVKKVMVGRDSTRKGAYLVAHQRADKWVSAGKSYDGKYKVVDVTYKNLTDNSADCYMTISYLVKVED